MLGITATFVVKAEQVLLSRRTPSYPRCQTEEHYLGSVSYSFGARSGGFDGEIPGSLGRLEALGPRGKVPDIMRQQTMCFRGRQWIIEAEEHIIP